MGWVSSLESEVDALGVITISRECFERYCSNRKTPPYHSNLSFVARRNRRPTLLRAPAYRTPSEASPRRRCGHAGRFLCEAGGWGGGSSRTASFCIALYIYTHTRTHARTHTHTRTHTSLSLSLSLSLARSLARSLSLRKFPHTIPTLVL